MGWVGQMHVSVDNTAFSMWKGASLHSAPSQGAAQCGSKGQLHSPHLTGASRTPPSPTPTLFMALAYSMLISLISAPESISRSFSFLLLSARPSMRLV